VGVLAYGLLLLGDVVRRDNAAVFSPFHRFNHIIKGDLIMSLANTRSSTPEAYRHSEGPVALTIEEQTAKIPSDVYLWAAVGSGAVSVMLHMTGEHKKGLFVGQWVPTFLILGLYNKIVKVAGSDRIHD
jgi:hypothetical protein